jgi:hypothetical protein
MKGENQSGASTISLVRLQYSRRSTAGPRERGRRRIRRRRGRRKKKKEEKEEEEKEEEEE